MTDDRSRRAIELAEAYIDGLVGKEDLKAAAWAAEDAIRGKRDRPGQLRLSAAYAALHAANVCRLDDTPTVALGPNVFAALKAAGTNPRGTEIESKASIQAVALLRDIAGNPFRQAPFDHRWRKPQVVAVARGIYVDRAFDRLPILADALLDAGCSEEYIIRHCQCDGLHTLGCWVIDLVLGKE
jgi:hypothetical protein